MNQVRAYSSPLRADQAAMTRDRILDAAVALLGDGDPSDLAMQDVAERAGVSVRTAYRHFPTRDDLLDGVVEAIADRLTGKVGSPPVTPEEYVDRAPDMVGAVLDIEPLYRALFATRAGHASHQRSAHRRRDEIQRAFAAETSELDDRQAALFGALVHLVTSSNAVLFLKDYWGLDADDAGRVVRWATRVMTDAVRDPEARGGL